jgi:hypothetical protein
LLQKEHTAGRDREVRHIFEEAERATAILRQLLWNAHETKMEMRTVAINQMVLAIEVQQASLAQGTNAPRAGPRYQLAAGSWRRWAVATGADEFDGERARP